MIFWGAVLAVHILCAAIWVGGLFFALLVLRPSLAVLEPEQRLAVHGQVFRRFFLVVWHVMPLTLLSGYEMLFGVYRGFAGADWSVNVMQLLGLVMAAIFVVIFVGPWATLRRAPAGPEAAASVDKIRKLVQANLVLGLATIAIAALGWR